MSKMILWFHTLPENPGQNKTDIDTDEPLEQAGLSAYSVDDRNKTIQPFYTGNFRQFLEEHTLWSNYQDVIVYLPARHISYHSVKVPVRSRSKVRQALPYLLEDYLLDDADACFFALGKITNGQAHVAVIKRNIMDFLHSQFQKKQLPVSWLSSEAFMFTDSETAKTVRCHQSDFLIVLNSQQAWSVDKNNAPLFFERIIQDEQLSSHENDPENRQTSESEAPDAETTLDQAYTDTEPFILYQSKDCALDVIINILENNDLSYELKEDNFINNTSLSYWEFKSAGINLLQEQYQLNTGSHRIPFFRTLIVFSIIGLLSQLSLMAYQWWFYEKQIAQVEQQIESTFFKLFPDARRIVDVRVQTNNRLNRLKSGASHEQSFLNLLTLAAFHIKSLKNTEIINIRYNNQTLIMDLLSQSFIFEQLKKQFSKYSNLEIKELSSSKNEKGIHSMISFHYSGKQ